MHGRTCCFKHRAVGPSEYLRMTKATNFPQWFFEKVVFMRFEIKRRNEFSIFEGSIATSVTTPVIITVNHMKYNSLLNL